MSRGNGHLQSAILESLQGVADSIPFESLRWTLWLGTEKPKQGNLPKTWNSSLGRAVDSLEKKKKVNVHWRPLQSFDEAVAYYPNKSLDAKTRQLRIELLPVLQRAIEEGEAFARYSAADNEEFHLESINEDVMKGLTQTWLTLETQLVRLLPELALLERNAVFCLLARGKSIFEGQDLAQTRSFSELLGVCVKGQMLPEKLREQVQALATTLLSQAQAGHLRLKAFVHSFAHVPKLRECTLKDDTVEYLMRMRRDYLQSLPGFVGAKRSAKSASIARMWELNQKDKQSPLLQKLLDKTIFQEFKFLVAN